MRPSHFLSLVLVISIAGCGQREVTDLPKPAFEVSGQAKPIQSISIPNNSKLALSSPDEIEKYINENEYAELKEVWKSLNIEPSSNFPEKCGGLNGLCKAERINLAANRKLRDLVFLRISIADANRYLIFKRNTPSEIERWKFLGHVDSLYQFETEPPKVRIVEGQNKLWLVVYELSGRGSGVLYHDEAWYPIEENMKEALRYVADGYYEMGGALGQKLASSEPVLNQVNGIPVIDRNISVIYLAYANADKPLFSKQYKVRFIWDAATNMFVFDASANKVSEGEYNSIAEIDPNDASKFVEYNHEDLLRIAIRGSKSEKEWLKDLLAVVPDSPQKRALYEILSK